MNKIEKRELYSFIWGTDLDDMQLLSKFDKGFSLFIMYY